MLNAEFVPHTYSFLRYNASFRDLPTPPRCSKKNRIAEEKEDAGEMINAHDIKKTNENR